MARITFIPRCRIPDEELDRRRHDAHRLGHPFIGLSGAVRPPLAVAGGGPSLARHLDALRAWEGEIWAINGTWRYLADRGIDAVFYTIDPHEMQHVRVDGVKRAILSDIASPGLFEMLKDADIEIAAIGDGGLASGSTSACCAVNIAAHRGHSRVTFFGCDSSFEDQTHADRNDMDECSVMEVSCGGKIYRTCPQMILQAEYMADTLAGLKAGGVDYADVVGDGFLSALIEHGGYDVIAIPRAMAERLKERAA